MKKDCEWYLDGFCIKDIDGARVWDCTCKDKEKRKQYSGFNCMNCPYPKIGKEYKK